MNCRFMRNTEPGFPNSAISDSNNGLIAWTPRRVPSGVNIIAYFSQLSVRRCEYPRHDTFMIRESQIGSSRKSALKAHLGAATGSLMEWDKKPIARGAYSLKMVA